MIRPNPSTNVTRLTATQIVQIRPEETIGEAIETTPWVADEQAVIRSSKRQNTPGIYIGKPLSVRQPDLSAIEVKPELVSQQNIIFMNNGEEVEAYFNKVMGDKSVRLATAGYLVPPAGYEDSTRNFLQELAKSLNGRMALLTSPTADKGSIDAITSQVGQKFDLPLGYVTTDCYLSSINPDKFPEDVNKKFFSSQPKFSFPDKEEYSQATATLSNSLLVTGGRNTTIDDFMNAIKKGNTVVVINNKKVHNAPWDANKAQVDNASTYLKQMISGEHNNIDMGNQFNQKVAGFLAENRERVGSKVLVVDFGDPKAVSQASVWLASSGTSKPASFSNRV